MAKKPGDPKPSKNVWKGSAYSELENQVLKSLPACVSCAKTGNSGKYCPHRKKK